jgi:hydrogenase maturation factor HypE
MTQLSELNHRLDYTRQELQVGEKGVGSRDDGGSA